MKPGIGADTNILFSGLYFGKAASSIIRLVRFKKTDLFVSEYIKDELLAICKRKNLPLKVLSIFFSLDNVHIIKDESYFDKEKFKDAKILIHDEKDVPIYCFAKKMFEYNKIEYFITGDKDLLDEKVRNSAHGRILSLAEFNEIMGL